MEEHISGAPQADGLSSATPIEPVPVSPVPASIPSAEERRYKSLADDHYRNARRLAHRLVATEAELRALKKGLVL